jgi:hypothetical protein
MLKSLVLAKLVKVKRLLLLLLILEIKRALRSCRELMY